MEHELQELAPSDDDVLQQTRVNQDRFISESIPSAEELGRRRVAAMRLFLDDYDEGLSAGRYVPAKPPTLPFQARSFDLALSSHTLFLNSDLLDEDFHFASIVEICRVAGEARIFPPLDYNSVRSSHLHRVSARLRDAGFEVSVERADYELQRGGNEMLRVRSIGLLSQQVEARP